MAEGDRKSDCDGKKYSDETLRNTAASQFFTTTQINRLNFFFEQQGDVVHRIYKNTNTVCGIMVLFIVFNKLLKDVRSVIIKSEHIFRKNLLLPVTFDDLLLKKYRKLCTSGEYILKCKYCDFISHLSYTMEHMAFVHDRHFGFGLKASNPPKKLKRSSSPSSATSTSSPLKARKDTAYLSHCIFQTANSGGRHLFRDHFTSLTNYRYKQLDVLFGNPSNPLNSCYSNYIQHLSKNGKIYTLDNCTHEQQIESETVMCPCIKKSILFYQSFHNNLFDILNTINLTNWRESRFEAIGYIRPQKLDNPKDDDGVSLSQFKYQKKRKHTRTVNSTDSIYKTFKELIQNVYFDFFVKESLEVIHVQNKTEMIDLCNDDDVGDNNNENQLVVNEVTLSSNATASSTFNNHHILQLQPQLNMQHSIPYGNLYNPVYYVIVSDDNQQLNGDKNQKQMMETPVDDQNQELKQLQQSVQLPEAVQVQLTETTQKINTQQESQRVVQSQEDQQLHLESNENLILKEKNKNTTVCRKRPLKKITPILPKPTLKSTPLIRPTSQLPVLLPTIITQNRSNSISPTSNLTQNRSNSISPGSLTDLSDSKNLSIDVVFASLLASKSTESLDNVQRKDVDVQQKDMQKDIDVQEDDQHKDDQHKDDQHKEDQQIEDQQIEDGEDQHFDDFANRQFDLIKNSTDASVVSKANNAASPNTVLSNAINSGDESLIYARDVNVSLITFRIPTPIPPSQPTTPLPSASPTFIPSSPLYHPSSPLHCPPDLRTSMSSDSRSSHTPVPSFHSSSSPSVSPFATTPPLPSTNETIQVLSKSKSSPEQSSPIQSSPMQSSPSQSAPSTTSPSTPVRQTTSKLGIAADTSPVTPITQVFRYNTRLSSQRQKLRRSNHRLIHKSKTKSPIKTNNNKNKNKINKSNKRQRSISNNEENQTPQIKRPRTSIGAKELKALTLDIRPESLLNYSNIRTRTEAARIRTQLLLQEQDRALDLRPITRSIDLCNIPPSNMTEYDPNASDDINACDELVRDEILRDELLNLHNERRRDYHQSMDNYQSDEFSENNRTAEDDDDDDWHNMWYNSHPPPAHMPLHTPLDYNNSIQNALQFNELNQAMSAANISNSLSPSPLPPIQPQSPAFIPPPPQIGSPQPTIVKVFEKYVFGSSLWDPIKEWDDLYELISSVEKINLLVDQYLLHQQDFFSYITDTDQRFRAFLQCCEIEQKLMTNDLDNSRSDDHVEDYGPDEFRDMERYSFTAIQNNRISNQLPFTYELSMGTSPPPHPPQLNAQATIAKFTQMPTIAEYSSTSHFRSHSTGHSGSYSRKSQSRAQSGSQSINQSMNHSNQSMSQSRSLYFGATNIQQIPTPPLSQEKEFEDIIKSFQFEVSDTFKASRENFINQILLTEIQEILNSETVQTQELSAVLSQLKKYIDYNNQTQPLNQSLSTDIVVEPVTEPVIEPESVTEPEIVIDPVIKPVVNKND